MLSGAVTLTLVNLLVSFANSQRGSNSILDQQKRVKEGLRTVLVSVMAQLESAMAQGTSVDITHRALKLQSGLISLSDERFVALCVTNANSAAVTRVRMLNDRLDTTKEELSEMEKRYQNTLQSHDNLNSAYHDQRLAFERQIEWTRSESRISAKYESEILAEERNQAEEQCKKESDARHIAEEKLEQLIRDSNNDKSRIKDLEELLTRELKSRKRIEYELDIRTKELSKSSIELERISSDNRDLENNLIISEDKVSELSAIRKEVETDLEEACSKLIKLATVYQRNEEDSEKYKAELRSAMNTANKHADTAIAKYEHSKKQIKLMSKQLEEATYELNSIKAHRADVQRMRKNAPVAYLNQLHNGKSQGRPNNSEKENSFNER
jgi:chromosome segregation ATPase